MARENRFFRDAGPVLLQLERRSALQLSATQFRGLALALGALALLLALVVWGRDSVVTVGYQLSDLRQQRDGLAAEQRRLQGHLAELQSLAYAETAARTRLGMVEINPNQVISLKRRSAAGDLMDDVTALFNHGGKAEAGPGKR